MGIKVVRWCIGNMIILILGRGIINSILVVCLLERKDWWQYWPIQSIITVVNIIIIVSIIYITIILKITLISTTTTIKIVQNIYKIGRYPTTIKIITAITATTITTTTNIHWIKRYKIHKPLIINESILRIQSISISYIFS